MQKKKNPAVRILKVIGIILLIIVLLFALLIGFLSVTEYKPADREELSIAGYGAGVIPAGGTLKVMTWNIGYGALGDNADFFMDGGTMVNTATEERVNENMEGIIGCIKEESPDLLLLQEADLSSDRSHRVNEVSLLRRALNDKVSTFANNFKVAYLPYPIPPMGKVDSGLLTMSGFDILSAERVQLPIPFSWPMRMANLKRCVSINRIPVEGGRELVIINLHLEAYDDGEGKRLQTEMLRDILAEEAANGNYVIAGGDFNQIFSSADTEKYPAQEGMWTAGEIDVSLFPSGWQFLMDESVPSCRSLDKAYAGADKDSFQYYLIDGFIVSSNVTVKSCETRDIGFTYTDHNPVVMEITLE